LGLFTSVIDAIPETRIVVTIGLGRCGWAPMGHLPAGMSALVLLP
jgi:hypothetical protein